MLAIETTKQKAYSFSRFVTIHKATLNNWSEDASTPKDAKEKLVHGIEWLASQPQEPTVIITNHGEVLVLYASYWGYTLSIHRQGQRLSSDTGLGQIPYSEALALIKREADYYNSLS